MKFYLNFIVFCLCLMIKGNKTSSSPNILRPHEVSKVYARKIINKFTDHEALTVSDFEKLLIKLESQNIKQNFSKACAGGLGFLRTIETDPENVTAAFAVDVDHVVSLCPVVLHKIAVKQSLFDRKSCFQEEKTAELESRTSVWLYSTLAIIGISLCGLFGVAVIPIVDKNFYFYVLQFFMALAVGTLTGDALLHLLPHAMRPTSDDLSKEDFRKMLMYRGIAALLGILFFSLFERSLTVITKWKNRDAIENEETLEKSNNHGHSHAKVNTESGSMSSIVWMVILGDGLHNFTDGMTIGAAFSNNIAGGFSTTVAVFCHELPHEMGDFAVLLKAGMSAKQAIFYNILSSVLSFFGMCVGILIGDAPETTQWVFAVAAGLFIYIALVDMVSKFVYELINII